MQLFHNPVLQYWNINISLSSSHVPSPVSVCEILLCLLPSPLHQGACHGTKLICKDTGKGKRVEFTYSKAKINLEVTVRQVHFESAIWRIKPIRR